MRIALIDLEEDRDGCNNKDQTGTYGSVMDSGGLAGRIFSLFKRKMVRLPILSFGYVASIFRKKGHTVSICNGLPDFVDLAIVATSIIGYKQEIAFARTLKQRQECTVGFTGAFAMAKPDLFLEEGDFVIHGEQEAWALQSDALEEPRGIVHAGRVDNVDCLPFPDWDGFPIDQYSYRPLLKNLPFLTLQTSRGCPYACSYCHYRPLQGSIWRMRNTESVLEEILYLKTKFHVRSLLFRDIVFSLDKKRTHQLMEGILKKGIDIEWGCETRVDHLDKKLIRHMKKAGLRFINLGIETLDEETLRTHGRKAFEHDYLSDIVRFSEEQGVYINAFYLIGFPRDTRESILRNLDYACNLNSSFAQFCVVTPLPGTEFYDEVLSAGRILVKDWSEYTTYNPVMRLDHLSPEEVRQLKKYSYNKYFLRPSWFFRRGLRILLGS